MRPKQESITIFEELYDGTSRYSKDFKCVYSIPEDPLFGRYKLKEGCQFLELKGRESTVETLILPSSFIAFHMESTYCLPYLKKIIAYSDFLFISDLGIIEPLFVLRYWEGTSLQEVCVLPELVDKYKEMFCCYHKNVLVHGIKVSAIQNDKLY